MNISIYTYTYVCIYVLFSFQNFKKSHSEICIIIILHFSYIWRCNNCEGIKIVEIIPSVLFTFYETVALENCVYVLYEIIIV